MAEYFAVCTVHLQPWREHSVGDHVGTLTVNGKGVSFQPIVRTGEIPGEFLQVHGDTLYFIVH
ncbi:MAG: hypothetical protein KAX78_07110, partial [Phycisphaerae bacterium]|nr:hypothetical protein [Phycisphaerae bacterium]